MRPLPQFAGTAGRGGRGSDGAYADDDLVTFVLEQYAAGRSLREIAELTDRSHSAVPYLLQRRGVLRRGRGAPPARGDAAPTT